MTFHEAQLVAYGAGSVIHGALLLLVLNLYRHTTGTDRTEAFGRIAVCLAGFMWMFGNLWHMSGLFHPIIGNLLWYIALVSFPFLGVRSLVEPTEGSRLSLVLTKIGRALSYPQAIFSLLAIASGFQEVLGKTPLLDPDFALKITMNLLLFYTTLFVVLGIIRRRKVRASGDYASISGNRLIIGLMPFVTLLCLLLLYYPGAIRSNVKWLELTIGMMTLPSTIGTAYRLYRFPFMDVFVRETLTGIILLIIFCTGFSTGPPGDWWPLWVAGLAMGVAAARAPLSRWVERRFLGYDESLEQQEERVGEAIRRVTHLAEFEENAGRIVRDELEAAWVSIAPKPDGRAAATFAIPDSPPLTLSLGRASMHARI